MMNTSPNHRALGSPVSRVASPRPPLHPRTNLSGADSPRARGAPVKPVSSPPALSRSHRVTPVGSPRRLSGTPDPSVASAQMRRRGSAQSFQQSKLIPRIRLQTDSSWYILWKTLILIDFLFGALAITAISQTGLSINWLYSDGDLPIYSCPSVPVMIGENQNLDGSDCVIYFSSDSSSYLGTTFPGITLLDGGYFGETTYPFPCSTFLSLSPAQKCQFQGWSDTFPTLKSSCEFTVSPVCDSAGNVTVGQVYALRGMSAACALIVLIYLVASLSTSVNWKTSTVPARQRRIDGSRPLADASAKEMSTVVDREWNQLDYELTISSITGSGRASRPGSTRSTQPLRSAQSPSTALFAETGHLKGSPKTSTLTPKEVFSSDLWRNRVNKSLSSEARARRRVALILQKVRIGVSVWLLYFAITVGVMQLLLYVLPSNYFTTTPRSVVSTVLFNSELLSKLLTAPTTWIDFLAVADLVIELLLVMISALAVLEWPALPVKVAHIVRTRNGIRRGTECDFAQAASDGAVYPDAVGVVLLVRENCSSESRRVSLVKRVQNLLTMFPPDSIFVVDSNPQSVVPVDTTWQALYSLSPLVRYCFVPDCDSKLFALYWFNAVWLPFLVRSGQAQPLTHLMVVEAIDDEFSLPSIPLDLTLPRENLVLNTDNLRAIHLPLSAVSSSGSSCWVPCQDMDLKLRAVRRLAESKIGSCTEVELAAAVWEREALGEALRRASARDTSSVQQLRSSLSVVKLRGRNHIASNPFSFVPTAVPNSYVDLLAYRMRHGIAGEMVKAPIALIEIFSVLSLCNFQSWTVKPFLLLGTVASGLIQYIRPFIVGAMVFRDPIAVGCVLASALGLTLVIEVILLLVFSARADLRQKWSVGPLLAYPLYRFVSCWFLELPAMFDYILGGCVRNATLGPEKRLRELQDVPACPPCHVVNWYTVWKGGDDSDLATAAGDDANDLLDDSLSSLGYASPRNFRSREGRM